MLTINASMQVSSIKNPLHLEGGGIFSFKVLKSVNANFSLVTNPTHTHHHSSFEIIVFSAMMIPTCCMENPGCYLVWLTKMVVYQSLFCSDPSLQHSL